MYNEAMNKRRIKEEDVVKISITTKRAEEEFDEYILKNLTAKKKRRSN